MLRLQGEIQGGRIPQPVWRQRRAQKKAKREYESYSMTGEEEPCSRFETVGHNAEKQQRDWNERYQQVYMTQ
jgi:hypothetical protein